MPMVPEKTVQSTERTVRSTEKTFCSFIYGHGEKEKDYLLSLDLNPGEVLEFKSD